MIRSFLSSNRQLIGWQPLKIPCALKHARHQDHRAGHIPKKDVLTGEKGTLPITYDCLELPDGNLMERVIDGVKFKDIPVLHVTCTKNNTKMALTDGSGRVDKTRSVGQEGYKNCRKGTTVAAQAVANRIVSYAKEGGYTMARLVFKGLGPGRGAAFKVIEMSGLKIVSLSDRTEAIEPWIKRPRKQRRV